MAVEDPTSPTDFIYDPDHTINNFKILSDQYSKETAIEQVPFKLGIPGPPSLRKRSTGYRVTLGDKKVD